MEGQNRDKKRVFQQLIADVRDKSWDHVIPRDQEIPFDIPKIVSLLGPHRGGKTFMLFDLAKTLRASIPSDRIVSPNFEDAN